jgi:hypothetical protein
MYAQSGTAVLGMMAVAGPGVSGGSAWGSVLAVTSGGVLVALAWARRRSRHNARAAGLR